MIADVIQHTALQIRTQEIWLSLIQAASVPSPVELLDELNRLTGNSVYSLASQHGLGEHWHSFSVASIQNDNVSTIHKFEIDQIPLRKFVDSATNQLQSIAGPESLNLLLDSLRSTTFAIGITHSDPNHLEKEDCEYTMHCVACDFTDRPDLDGMWYTNFDNQTFFGNDLEPYCEFEGTIALEGAG